MGLRRSLSGFGGGGGVNRGRRYKKKIINRKTREPLGAPIACGGESAGDDSICLVASERERFQSVVWSGKYSKSQEKQREVHGGEGSFCNWWGWAGSGGVSPSVRGAPRFMCFYTPDRVIIHSGKDGTAAAMGFIAASASKEGSAVKIIGRRGGFSFKRWNIESLGASLPQQKT